MIPAPKSSAARMISLRLFLGYDCRSFGSSRLYADLRKSTTASTGAMPRYLSNSRTCWAFDKGVLAWYKLGWIYYFLEDRPQAAEAFLQYVEKESSTEPSALFSE